MKKNRFLAAIAAAVMAVSAVPAMTAVPASAIRTDGSCSAYADFSTVNELNEHISKHGGNVTARDPWTDESFTYEDVQSIWVPAGFSQYESSISNIRFCDDYISVSFSFSNGYYTLYFYGIGTTGKSIYNSMKTSPDKQKVDGRTVYRSGANYCWKQSGSYFMLTSSGGNVFSYCSAEEYLLPEYTQEGISYIGGKKYYVQSDGSYYVGWKTINGNKYFFGMDGAALTQNTIIGNVRYVFEPSGVCTGTYTGWLDKDGFRYYCKNGRFVTGVNKISGKTYTFSSEGILLSAYPA